MKASKRQCQHSRSQSIVRRAAVESLEQRLVFSTITVNTLLDNTTSDNFMSLREAVALMDAGGDSNAALSRSLTSQELAQIDTTDAFGTNNRIVFDDSIAGDDINLLSSLDIDGTMTIDAGEDGITLIGGGSSSDYRAFAVAGGADLTLDGVTVTDFHAYNGGGAMIVDGNATIRNSSFTQNMTTGQSTFDGLGGAIYVLGTLTISNSSLTDNTATGSVAHEGRGGAIYAALGTTLTVQSSTFSGNLAQGGDDVSLAGSGRGGAIYNDNATLDIKTSTFNDNIAAGGSAFFIDGSAIGGAIDSIDGVLNITNSTFTANVSQAGGNTDGGAIHAVDGLIDINFATIAGNTASGYGAGLMYEAMNPGSTLAINNSIISQNTGFNDIAVLDGNNWTTYSGSNNLIGDDQTHLNGRTIGFSTADPLLNALANNGGPTWTMSPQAGSPAINAADATLLTTDQRGQNRVVGAAADIGAYELASSPTITTGTSTTFYVGGVNSFDIETHTDGATPALSLQGALPTGVTFTDNGDGTATLSGTPSSGTAGVYNLSITADNGTSPDDVQSFTLNVHTTPSFTSVPAATFNPDKPGTFTVITAGTPTAALTYTGTLPTGVTFHDNGDGTATIAGTAGAAALGDHTITIFADNTSGIVAQQNFTLTVANATTTVVTSVGGSGGLITVTDPNGGQLFSIQNPFPGAASPRIATAESGDIIVASGQRTRAKVFVYDGDSGNQLAEIDPFGNYKGGVFVAAGDVNHDGTDDIIVSAGKRAGSKASIRVYDGVTYGLIADIWAFNDGKNIAVTSADLDGDGYAEVIATKGSKVRVFDGHDLSANVVTIRSEFTPFGGYAGGLFVATGDINGDHHADIIVSQGAGNRPWISVFNGSDSSLQKKIRVTAFNGTPIAVRDFNSDGHDDIFAVTRSGGKNAVSVLSGLDDSILETIDTDGKGRLFLA